MLKVNERETIANNLQRVSDNLPLYALLSEYTPRVYDGSSTCEGVCFEGLIKSGKFRGFQIKVVQDKGELYISPVCARKDYDPVGSERLARQIARDLERQASAF